MGIGRAGSEVQRAMKVRRETDQVHAEMRGFRRKALEASTDADPGDAFKYRTTSGVESVQGPD